MKTELSVAEERVLVYKSRVETRVFETQDIKGSRDSEVRDGDNRSVI